MRPLASSLFFLASILISTPALAWQTCASDKTLEYELVQREGRLGSDGRGDGPYPLITYFYILPGVKKNENFRYSDTLDNFVEKSDNFSYFAKCVTDFNAPPWQRVLCKDHAGNSLQTEANCVINCNKQSVPMFKDKNGLPGKYWANPWASAEYSSCKMKKYWSYSGSWLHYLSDSGEIYTGKFLYRVDEYDINLRSKSTWAGF